MARPPIPRPHSLLAMLSPLLLLLPSADADALAAVSGEDLSHLERPDLRAPPEGRRGRLSASPKVIEPVEAEEAAAPESAPAAPGAPAQDGARPASADEAGDAEADEDRREDDYEDDNADEGEDGYDQEYDDGDNGRYEGEDD